MINRLFWEILSQDSIDENQAAFNLDLQNRYPNITDTSHFVYWQSLKTLLGDSSDEWSENKIIDKQARITELSEYTATEKLPVISISQNTGFRPTDQSQSTFEGEMCIFIETGADSNTLQCFNIYKRIKRVLFPTTRQGITLNENCKAFPNYGINKLIWTLDRVDEFYNHSVKLYLRAKYQEI